MRGRIIVALALAGSSVSAAPSAAPGDSCEKGLRILVARGTGEDKGTGLAGTVADSVASQIRGSTVVPIDYPATLVDPSYDESLKAGAEALQKAVNEHVKACPDSKIVIMGYSQGAHITVDSICGGSGEPLNNITALPQKLVEDHVVAVVLFGDPTHIANVTYDKGTSTNNGIFPRVRASVEQCNVYADRLVSYCDKGDRYCDHGDVKEVHSEYFEKYDKEIVKFVVQKYDSFAKASATSTATATAATSSATISPATSSATHTNATTVTGASATPTKPVAGAAAGLTLGHALYLALPMMMMASFQIL
ncbi:hypothetical protein DCS_06434 [Drechmeria coniospora]|uniref:Acetylxylan esterase n=1 Tax=Drechmeria coniospora TaxID=98403 RepID=A0A151GBH6_DRECN|nr:hypothetical protein DCS_06434 [Drechmeria coniospora]KYK54476.1 hypothetical protein DCS_06434 [Drechmeria coniospora]ODA77244.1 hypothetical protein RJ55_06871 [Drechmeria coniospora]